MDPDQTAPIGAVCSASTLFAPILNSSVMLGNYLQQTTFSDALDALRVKKKHKNAIYIICGYFNLPDIDWKKSTVTNKFYPHKVSQTYPGMVQELGLEQLLDFSHKTGKHTGPDIH